MATLPRRIVLIGSESTGKTTMARQLADRLGTIWVPEFAREYAEARAGRLSADDVEPIARGQHQSELEALARGRPTVIFDTDLVSTAIYASHYYGLTLDWVEAAIRDHPPSRYLLCDIDLPWVADSVRDRGDERAVLQGLFRAELERRQLRPTVISGSGPRRLAAALEALSLQ